MPSKWSRAVVLGVLGLLIGGCGNPAAVQGPAPPACGRTPLTDGSVGCIVRAEPPVTSTLATSTAPAPPLFLFDRFGAQRVEIEQSLVDVHPVPWNRLEVTPDGRTVTLYWDGALPRCSGVDRVEVDIDGPGPVVVTLYVGRDPDVRACPEMAAFKRITVRLDEPIIQSGA